MSSSASDDPEVLKVREWRHILQKKFLSKSAPVPPSQDDMRDMDALFTTLEDYQDMTSEYLTLSKIGKVMRHISLLEPHCIPGDDEFKLLDRAKVLVDKWHQILIGNGPKGMHRCLDVVELVELLCSELRLLPRGQSALAALARTCKQLQGPALDHLWHHQYTLRHILGCMPAGLFDTYEDLGNPGIKRMRLLRPIVNGDWQRPMEYAHRVGVLKLTLPNDNNRFSFMSPVQQ
ncbi:hypothetical protein FB451DRAFT_126112 [Mycena latifolia]|nr:hypothetical protein FB451DRAFT_126112 [Mycena latifolia]